MGALKGVSALAFLIIIVSLLTIYYIEPFTELEFNVQPSNYNFTLNATTSGSGFEDMQFYPNMRFPTNRITYNIADECSLMKRQDMEDGFDIVENLTLLEFSPTNSNADINVTCNETTRYQDGIFIAGEGGPASIVEAGEFYVIGGGTILLIRDSGCERPNIAIHELFHVLGFEHSNNPNNIMYNFTKCSQTIGDDNIQLLNELYSIESLPDLAFDSPREIEDNTGVFMHGRYLDLNVTVRNNGLKDSPQSIVKIFADEKEIREFLLDELEIGNGKVISLRNVWVTKRNPQIIELKIATEFDELSKENNIISFKVSDDE